MQRKSFFLISDNIILFTNLFIMHNRLFFILITTFLVAFFSSCSPKEKDGYIKEFASFVDEVEKNADKYSHKDWDKAEDKFEDYVDDLFEQFADELSTDDKVSIGQLALRYHNISVAHGQLDIPSEALALEKFARKADTIIDPNKHLRQQGFQVEELVEGPDISDLFE